MKSLIYLKLEKDTTNFKLVYYDGSLWFINRKKKEWMIECRDGSVIWNYDFFGIVPSLFGVKKYVFEDVIKEWVQNKINYNVKTCYYYCGDRENEIKSLIESDIY